MRRGIEWTGDVMSDKTQSRGSLQSDSFTRSAECPRCGRRVRILIPAGGDGSADIYVRHNDRNGNRCEMSRMIVKDEAPSDQAEAPDK